MRQYLIRTTIYGKIAAYAKTWESDVRWQASEIEFWQKMYDSSKNIDIRLERGYGNKLILAEQKLETLKALENL